MGTAAYRPRRKGRDKREMWLDKRDGDGQGRLLKRVELTQLARGGSLVGCKVLRSPRPKPAQQVRLR